MRSILYYITGHGFGHAVRSNLVIQALQRAAPELRTYVRTSAPDWLFDSPERPVSYGRESLDVGIVQPNSLQMDLPATLRAWQDLRRRRTELIAQELNFIQAHRIGLIIGDIPPLGFEIAARAGIPSVAVTNFTWDVIYRAYSATYPEFVPLIEEMRQSYGRATLALTLPYPCDTSMFTRTEAIPWVARVSELTRARARVKYGLPPDATVVLVSFGGLGLEMLPWDKLEGLKSCFFVTTGSAARRRDNLLVLDNAQRSYQDLVRAADVIVTKPGYGIVADAISHRVPMLYTDRGEFPEYPYLVTALSDIAIAEYIPQPALNMGTWKPYLDKLLAKRSHWPDVPINGAEVAAGKILALVDGV